MSTNPVTFPSSTQNTTNSQSNPAAASPTDGLANEQTFLQLLIAQIKNQDPTNPTDSTQFLTQLAQFSQLEQLIGIHQDLNSLAPAQTATQQTTTSN